MTTVHQILGSTPDTNRIIGLSKWHSGILSSYLSFHSVFLSFLYFFLFCISFNNNNSEVLLGANIHRPDASGVPFCISFLSFNLTIKELIHKFELKTLSSHICCFSLFVCFNQFPMQTHCRPYSQNILIDFKLV